jgi:hypothetical protein
MTWNDHNHRGEYAEDGHDHYDYADRHHRHYDLENDDEKAQRRITALQDELDGLRGQLGDALGRISALENTNTLLVMALRKLAAEHESVILAGIADDCRLAIAEDLAETFTVLAETLADEPEPEPEPEEYDPGPEVDDEGGMSEYRYILPEDYQRGQS